MLLLPLNVQPPITPADGEYFAAAHEGSGRQVIYLWECEAEARVNAVLEAPRWVGGGMAAWCEQADVAATDVMLAGLPACRA